MNEKQRNFLKTVPKLRQNLFKGAFEGSRPNAVKAKCFDCCGFDVREASFCTCDICPLIEVNPYRKARLKREASGITIEISENDLENDIDETENENGEN